MATVIFVHRIAQEQPAAAVLENYWPPALADGVVKSGNHNLADRIYLEFP